MLNDRAIFTLVIVGFAAIYILANFRRIRGIPASSTLLAGISVLYFGWLVTLFDQRLPVEVVLVIEHGCYTTYAICVAYWTWQTFIAKARA